MTNIKVNKNKNQIKKPFSFLNEVDRMFDDFWASPKVSKSNTDIIEYDDRYEIKMDIPGVNKENIDILIENGLLKISAQRETSNENNDGKYLSYSKKRQSHKFNVNIGRGQINIENVSAKAENGILTVDLPKKEVNEADHKKIDVE